MTFEVRPSKPVLEILSETIKPLLSQIMDPDVSIALRQMNEFPKDVCFDHKLYAVILF